MHTQKSAAIVLRKIAGRLEACWSSTARVAGVRGGDTVPSIAGLAGAFALLLMLPLFALGALVLGIKFGAPVALAFLAKSVLVKGLSLANAPVASGVKEIKDEILRAFEEFKSANDQEIAEIKKNGTASAETSQQVERLNAALSDMQAKITRLTVNGVGGGDEPQMDAETKKKLQAFFHPSPEERNGRAELTFAFGSKSNRIQAAQAVGTAGAGGAIVAPSFSNRLEKALLFFSGMMQTSEIVTTETGVDLPWPTVNDTTQVGARLTENSTIPQQDIAFSSVTLKAWMYTSKAILVSWQLMQDAYFDVEGMVGDLAGERLGRILNTELTVGTGSGASMPNGIITAATLGKTGLVGQTTSVIYDDIVDLIHSVDVAYRKGSKFQLADSSLKVIRKLKDSQGRPLWEPSLQAGMPDNILGYDVVVNNDVPAMAANAKSIAFGALDKYKVRRVRDITLVRLNERYADNLQTGFFAYARFDGNLINAGTNPVKYYANSAT